MNKKNRTVLSLLSDVKKAHSQGISYKEYTRISKEKAQRTQLQREGYIQHVCEKSGWDRETAERKMEAAREMGITYFNYAKNECWKKDDEGLAKLLRWLKKEKIRKQENITAYIEKICAETGWSMGVAKTKVQEAQAACGTGYEDYYLFKLYDHSKEKQKEFLTFDVFSKLKLRYNDYSNQDIFNNKVDFNSLFTDVIKRQWFYNKDISYEDFVSKTDGLTHLFAKPLRGTQGKGIEKIELTDNKQEIYEKITSMKDMIVEEYITQHSKMSSLCQTSVNTVRVVTIHRDGKCNFVCAGLRMGQDKIVDNFHAGGMIAGVDVTTGELVTDAVNYNREVFKKHPVTGQTIRGFKIPNWEMLLETCSKISGRVEGINLVGWDFAIVENGVELIEGNPGPSYVMQQLPYAMDGIGIRHFVKDFI